jgi:hypothetical protein
VGSRGLLTQARRRAPYLHTCLSRWIGDVPGERSNWFADSSRARFVPACSSCQSCQPKRPFPVGTAGLLICTTSNLERMAERGGQAAARSSRGSRERAAGVLAARRSVGLLGDLPADGRTDPFVEGLDLHRLESLRGGGGGHGVSTTGVRSALDSPQLRQLAARGLQHKLGVRGCLRPGVLTLRLLN